MIGLVVAAVAGAGTGGLLAIVNQRHQRRVDYKDRLRAAYAEWINASRALAQLIYSQATTPGLLGLLGPEVMEDPLNRVLRERSLDLFVQQSHAETSLLLLEEKDYWRRKVQGATELLPTAPQHPQWEAMHRHLSEPGRRRTWPPFEEAINKLEKELIESEHLRPERRL